ncbi:hypothetical protein AX289_17360 [Methylorubrum populi]|nr:hypothetical protein AX289_17360 [Methylorubrum populi]
MFDTNPHTGIDQGVAVGLALAVGNRIRGQEIAHENDLLLAEQAHEADLARYQAVIDQLRQQLISTQVELVSERCEIAGLRALISEVKRQDPTTPALASSGETFRNGRAKSFATLMYERAYDKEAVEQGFPGLQGGYAA